MGTNDVAQSLGRLAEAESKGELSASAAANIKRWLTEAPFAAYLPKLVDDIDVGRWKVLDDAFYAVLEFGTGGRRGRMYPVGTNVLNARTIGESARGLADYVTGRKGAGSPRSCVIAHDTRHNSVEFSRICARVLAAAGFKVYLFQGVRSTPLLSFAVRHLATDAGIMITASHNPPSDNGFKCYAATGGQVLPPDDSGIIECVRKASDHEIPEVDFDAAVTAGQIVMVGEEVDTAYIRAVCDAGLGDARDLKIVYTPMHGVGETSVAASLLAAGFKDLNILASQRTQDGDFPNVPGHVSNPEIPKTLGAAIEEAKATGADLVLASDPDADRIGVGLPVNGDPSGDWCTLDGNQIGVVLAAYVLEKVKAARGIRSDSYMITTLVSTQMTKALAKLEGVRVEDNLLVGFKWIGLAIDQNGPDGFLYGFEESHGYLRGTHARDKDASIAALLFAQCAADLKAKGKTVIEFLDEQYLKVGHFGERLINKTLEGREGVAQIQTLMKAFRENPPRMMGGLAVTEVRDYKAHAIRDLTTGATSPLPEPSGDLLIFQTEADGTRFAARPSGTEPKIKFYLFARTGTEGVSNLEELAARKQKTHQQLDALAFDIEQFLRATLSNA